MEIKIENKYIFILDNYGNQVQYFENFEEKNIKNPVIKVSIEDRNGEKFIKENNYKILEAKIYWFGKKINGNPMFIKGAKNSAFSWLVINNL